jgi:hypothetical protein
MDRQTHLGDRFYFLFCFRFSKWGKFNGNSKTILFCIFREVRNFLTERLSAPVLNDLMSTMYNIAQYNDKHEHGLLTLQAMLMNEAVADFRIAPAKFYKNFFSGESVGSIFLC